MDWDGMSPRIIKSKDDTRDDTRVGVDGVIDQPRAGQ